jgi:hypothetical protein
MGTLPPEILKAVPHIKFLIFDLAIPNLIAWIVIIVAFFLAAWLRLPKFLESSGGEGG